MARPSDDNVYKLFRLSLFDIKRFWDFPHWLEEIRDMSLFSTGCLGQCDATVLQHVWEDTFNFEKTFILSLGRRESAKRPVQRACTVCV